MKIEAKCTWGDGPDVMLCSEDFKAFNLSAVIDEHSVHGVIKDWQVCLTADEALFLALSLQSAAYMAKNLEKLSNGSREELIRDCPRKNDYGYDKMNHVVCLVLDDKFPWVECTCGLYGAQEDTKEDAIYAWDNGSLWYTDTEKVDQVCYMDR